MELRRGAKIAQRVECVSDAQARIVGRLQLAAANTVKHSLEIHERTGKLLLTRRVSQVTEHACNIGIGTDR